MKLAKSVYDLNKTFFSNDSFMASKDKGKSVYLTGDNEETGLNRMEADRLEIYAENLENTAWHAYSVGNMQMFDSLMAQVQQVRKMADMQRRATGG